VNLLAWMRPIWRALGRSGGKARAAKLSKQELSDQGRNAVMVRWKKFRRDRAKTASRSLV